MHEDCAYCGKYPCKKGGLTMKFEKEAVRLVSAGYEWTCPECDAHQLEMTYANYVTCSECCKNFQISKNEHKFDPEEY